MRYGARFTPLVNGVVLQKGECKKAGIWRVSFRCRCAEHWVAVRVLCAAKDAEHLFLFDRTEHFPPHTHRAHCAATAEREAQWDKSAAVHLRTSEQSTHSRKTRSALHQRKCGRRRSAVSSLHQSAQPILFPAPARSAVKRTGSVTTGHNPHNILTTCAAKGERRLPSGLLPKAPLFLLHRARRSSFSPHPEKKKRGVHSQQKKAYFQVKRTPVLKGTPLPRHTSGKRAGSILQDRKPALPIKGAHSPPECETPSPAAAAPGGHPRSR